MKVAGVYIVVALFLVVSASAMRAQRLPACRTHLLTRTGDRVSMTLTALGKTFNQKLRAAHSAFSNLQFSDKGNNHLKISGMKDGKPISISGPLQVTSAGELQLHADHIKQNGSGVKGFMDLFGQKLSDKVDLKHTPSLSVQGNDLKVNTDELLGLHGRLKNVQLNGPRIQMEFASRPCR